VTVAPGAKGPENNVLRALLSGHHLETFVSQPSCSVPTLEPDYDSRDNLLRKGTFSIKESSTDHHRTVHIP